MVIFHGKLLVDQRVTTFTLYFPGTFRSTRSVSFLKPPVFRDARRASHGPADDGHGAMRDVEGFGGAQLARRGGKKQRGY